MKKRRASVATLANYIGPATATQFKAKYRNRFRAEKRAEDALRKAQPPV